MGCARSPRACRRTPPQLRRHCSPPCTGPTGTRRRSSPGPCRSNPTDRRSTASPKARNVAVSGIASFAICA
uniref:Uncharacterized protein n=1 Tax=Triticum urartu TaxID=4572 RepID=A0A8R7TJY8_TRIUA